MNYYNEIEPYCVQWLRNLIAEGLIPDGHVDDRSIRDVRPKDLAGYRQCHFFAGIAGWSLALAMAEWPTDREVWTGSCPCQPFSSAGARKGFADDRHLWPEFHRLIAQRRPATVFGEQVARAAEWLGVVRSNLEALEYAVGAMPIEAASVGAPHKRDRFWFVANSHGQRQRRLSFDAEVASPPQSLANPGRGSIQHRRTPGELDRPEREASGQAQSQDVPTATRSGSTVVANAHEFGAHERNARRWKQPELECNQSAGHRGNASLAGGEGLEERQGTEREWAHPTAPGSNWWTVEPPLGRLAHGISARVGKLRAFGNAIVPQVAAEFIRAAS